MVFAAVLLCTCAATVPARRDFGLAAGAREASALDMSVAAWRFPVKHAIAGAAPWQATQQVWSAHTNTRSLVKPSVIVAKDGNTRLNGVSAQAEDRAKDSQTSGGLLVTDADRGWIFALPEDWSGRVDVTVGARLLHASWHNDILSNTLYKAQSAEDPRLDLVFKVLEDGDPQAKRESDVRQHIGMMQKRGLINFWGIIPSYGSRSTGSEVILAMACADGDLKHYLRNKTFDHAYNRHKDGDPFVMPLPESLPIIADLLHGVCNLARAQVRLADLDSSHVLIKGGRAFITDFGCACIGERTGTDQHRDANVLCELCQECDGDLFGSAYRHAPEMVEGVPTGLESNMWGVGLIAAEMVFGFLPTNSDGAQSIDRDRKEETRREIRKHIRDKFSIRSTRGFTTLPTDIQDFLAGLLEKDPAARWSPEAALERLGVVAAAHSVKLPEAEAMWRHPSDAFD